MSEFKPTKRDLINLEIKLSKLKKDRSSLVEKKIDTESKLTFLQNKYRDVEFNGPQFEEIKSKRKQLKSIAKTVELQIVELNEEIGYKNNLKKEVEIYLKHNKEKSDSSKKALEALMKLKQHYGAFAKDKTRVSSMRIMAAEFRDEIEKIIGAF